MRAWLRREAVLPRRQSRMVVRGIPVERAILQSFKPRVTSFLTSKYSECERMIKYGGWDSNPQVLTDNAF